MGIKVNEWTQLKGPSEMLSVVYIMRRWQTWTCRSVIIVLRWKWHWAPCSTWRFNCSHFWVNSVKMWFSQSIQDSPFWDCIAVVRSYISSRHGEERLLGCLLPGPASDEMPCSIQSPGSRTFPGWHLLRHLGSLWSLLVFSIGPPFAFRTSQPRGCDEGASSL